jgi:hypothetical protein
MTDDRDSVALLYEDRTVRRLTASGRPKSARTISSNDERQRPSGDAIRGRACTSATADAQQPAANIATVRSHAP